MILNPFISSMQTEPYNGEKKHADTAAGYQTSINKRMFGKQQNAKHIHEHEHEHAYTINGFQTKNNTVSENFYIRKI